MFRLIVSTVISVFASALVFICLATDVLNNWMLSFFYSFRLHLGVLAILAAFMAILFYRRNWVAYALVALATATTIDAAFEIRAHAPAPVAKEVLEASASLRVLSFNVLGANPHGDQAVKEITALDPDIAVILEAKSIARFLPGLSARFPYRIGCGVVDPGCDSLILSKFPLENMRKYTLSNISANRMLVADFGFGGQSIRVVSAHLTKPYYDEKQREEIWEAIRHLHKYSGNLILAGDFNSSFLQPSTRNLLRWLDLRAGPREPGTWPVGSGFFGIPIDHILARPPLTIVSTQRIENNAGSNHYGIYSDIKVPWAPGRQANDVIAATP